MHAWVVASHRLDVGLARLGSQFLGGACDMTVLLYAWVQLSAALHCVLFLMCAGYLFALHAQHATTVCGCEGSVCLAGVGVGWLCGPSTQHMF